MRTIWKQTLEVTDTQEIQVPSKFGFISLQVQYDQVNMWYLCDPESPKKKVTIYCRGTGHNVDLPKHRDVNYIILGTVQLMGGQLVFHYFMRQDDQDGNF